MMLNHTKQKSHENRKHAESGLEPASLDPEGVYFFLSSFRDDAADEILLAPMPPNKKNFISKPPKGMPAYLSHLWTMPLLTAEQEFHGFRKLNYLKYRVSFLDKNLRSCVGCAAMPDDLNQLNHQCAEVRNLLIESNLRLVVSLSKKYASWNSNEFDEMVSVGNAALIHAVDLFDFRRGFRFGTYAYQAIQSSIFSSYRKEGRIKSRFVTSGSEAVELAIGDAGQSAIAELQSAEAREQVIQLIESLDERDQMIVMARFGINQKRKGVAFQVIAKEIGLSPTRTVQLFHRSLAKMRRLINTRSSFSY